MAVFDLVIILIICSFLALVTYHKGLLNADGSMAAFLIGFIIALKGGLSCILILLVFLFSAFLATKYKFPYKKQKNVAEGFKGERGWTNVLANGIVPAGVLLLGSSEGILNIRFLDQRFVIPLFLVSVAAAASDTLASEIGVTSDSVYLITNMEKVEPGTNGGISVYGEFWAFIGSLYTFLVAEMVFYISGRGLISPKILLIGTFIGFIGCQIDSLLGAVFERKGLLTKSLVNLIAISSAVCIFGGLLWLIGY